ncbi:hypothetical protein TSUD_159490 [Trifolium subterraneum]|uniref:Uncharacterized protein n=1 Tax=Trifolium subterraneum TaxID=3900 RepID=A0A2Z6NGA6_TRISU|nr:hypothetical protein TSUD_159490 [Trifolium subterraneum]
MVPTIGRLWFLVNLCVDSEGLGWSFRGGYYLRCFVHDAGLKNQEERHKNKEKEAVMIREKKPGYDHFLQSGLLLIRGKKEPRPSIVVFRYGDHPRGRQLLSINCRGHGEFLQDEDLLELFLIFLERCVGS